MTSGWAAAVGARRAKRERASRAMHGSTEYRGGRLPAQALVEDELGHGCWGISPVGAGLGRLVPQRGAACGGHFRWAGGLAQMPQDRVHGRRLGE